MALYVSSSLQPYHKLEFTSPRWEFGRSHYRKHSTPAAIYVVYVVILMSLVSASMVYVAAVVFVRW
jgi:hypothetical protein